MKNQEDVLQELEAANQQVASLTASLNELKGQLAQVQAARDRAEGGHQALLKEVAELKEQLAAKDQRISEALAESEKRARELKAQSEALEAQFEKKLAERLSAMGISGSAAAEGKAAGQDPEHPQVGRLTLAALKERGFKSLEEALSAPVKL